MAIEWKEGTVVMLDQSRLPFEIRFIECRDYRTVAEGIRKLWIRGAPAIGIAAAMGIALGAQEIEGNSYEEFMRGIEPLFQVMLATRPTAVNIQWAVSRIRHLLERNRHMTVPELKALLIREAVGILNEDISVNKTIGRWGSDLIQEGCSVLTHCNAGALATGGYGTATAPLFLAKEEGKRFHVFVDETRPVLQGARLTAWELKEAGIPFTLITDNSAGALMRKGEIDLVIVGTDRVARNGDVANKIGTYSVAVLAHENSIPFYVAAPLSSIDLSIPSGDDIPIEERDPSEVVQVYGKVVSCSKGGVLRPFPDEALCTVRIAPDSVSAKNLAFDITPHRYITGIITEKGILRPGAIQDIVK